MDSKQMAYGDKMADDLKVRTADTEKVTINLGLIDLGQIDLLVQEGFYSNRTDLIRTAIRNQLSTHGDVIRQTVARKSLVLGPGLAALHPRRPGSSAGGRADAADTGARLGDHRIGCVARTGASRHQRNFSTGGTACQPRRQGRFGRTDTLTDKETDS
jgi:Arc/MetJ-type ribon-helix-helix transcriptional regulator